MQLFALLAQIANMNKRVCIAAPKSTSSVLNVLRTARVVHFCMIDDVMNFSIALLGKEMLTLNSNLEVSATTEHHYILLTRLRKVRCFLHTLRKPTRVLSVLSAGLLEHCIDIVKKAANVSRELAYEALGALSDSARASAVAATSVVLAASCVVFRNRRVFNIHTVAYFVTCCTRYKMTVPVMLNSESAMSLLGYALRACFDGVGVGQRYIMPRQTLLFTTHVSETFTVSIKRYVAGFFMGKVHEIDSSACFRAKYLWLLMYGVPKSKKGLYLQRVSDVASLHNRIRSAPCDYGHWPVIHDDDCDRMWHDNKRILLPCLPYFQRLDDDKRALVRRWASFKLTRAVVLRTMGSKDMPHDVDAAARAALLHINSTRVSRQQDTLPRWCQFN